MFICVYSVHNKLSTTKLRLFEKNIVIASLLPDRPLWTEKGMHAFNVHILDSVAELIKSIRTFVLIRLLFLFCTFSFVASHVLIDIKCHAIFATQFQQDQRKHAQSWNYFH